MKRNKPPQDHHGALELYSSDAYLTINKRLLQRYGPDVTIYLCNLIDKYRYFLKQNTLINNAFFLTHEQQMEQTGLSITRLRNCKEILKSEQILSIKRIGTPSKEYYTINFSRLTPISQPSGILSASPQESLVQAISNPEGSTFNYNKENKYNNNSDKIKDKIEVKIQNKIPPKLEWIEEYCKLRRNNIDAEMFFNFYQSKGWMVGSNKMKDWHAAIHTWEKSDRAKPKQKQTKSDLDLIEDTPIPAWVKKLHADE
jgi:hypothetical protein